MYILGIITGLIVSVIVLVITLWQKPKVERMYHQTASKLKEKGKIIEPENEELEDWIENLKDENSTQ